MFGNFPIASLQTARLEESIYGCGSAGIHAAERFFCIFSCLVLEYGRKFCGEEQIPFISRDIGQCYALRVGARSVPVSSCSFKQSRFSSLSMQTGLEVQRVYL